MERVCANDECKKPFEAKRADARYCSPGCRSKAYRAQKEGEEAPDPANVSDELDGLEVDPGPAQASTLPAFRAETTIYSSPAIPDLAPLLQRIAGVESRLSRLEQTTPSDTAIQELHQELAKVRQELQKLRLEQAGQPRLDETTVRKLVRNEIFSEMKRAHDSTVEAYRLQELQRAPERLTRLEAAITRLSTPAFPAWLQEVPQRLQHLEQKVAATPMPTLPDWLPELPRRLKVLEQRFAQPVAAVLPDWLHDVPRRLRELEMRHANQEPASLPDTIVELPRRVRNLERQLEKTGGGTPTLPAWLQELPRRLQQLEAQAGSNGLPAEVTGRLAALEELVRKVVRRTKRLEQDITEFAHGISAAVGGDDEE